jgi:hypothetical protein
VRGAPILRPWLLLALGALAACGSTPAPTAARGPQPALLAFDATSGADVRVDGVEVGTLPLPSAIPAEPGAHRVELRLTGHEPEARTVQLQRGKTTTVTVDLSETAQRTGAWVAIGSGAAGLSAGIVLGVAAVVEDRAASDLARGGDTTTGTEYEDAVAARDRYRVGSGIAAGTGLGLFVVGAFLFAFDDPPLPNSPNEAALSVTPVFGPGSIGASAAAHF